MSTGLIGSVSITASAANVVVNSASLTYTCPAGVRYAIIKVAASATASMCMETLASINNNLFTASVSVNAGTVGASATATNTVYNNTQGYSGSSNGSSNALEYTVILASGQTWTGTCTIVSGSNDPSKTVMVATASLTASAFEVI